MKHRATRWIAVTACGGLMTLAALPARAALFDDNEARSRIEQTNQRIDQVRKVLDERLAAVETQLRNQGLADLFAQIEQLKAEVAKLRGQLEVMTYELSEAQKRQRDLYVDLDSRMRRLESAGTPAPSAGPAATPGEATANLPGSAPPATGSSFGPPPPSATGSLPPRAAADAAGEQRAYDSALDLFKSGNYGAAVQSFAAFVRANPRSALAPSAQYWIGNAQFALHDFRAAIASQRQLVASYPDSQKVPDALLNIATSQFELGDMTASRRTLEDLIARFPQSDAAAKARQRLASR